MSNDGESRGTNAGKKPWKRTKAPPISAEVFRDELMPLLENIHGETRHSGKVPKRAPRNTQQQTTLIQLRNELKRAVAAEDYEAAARLRDKIKGIELEQGRY